MSEHTENAEASNATPSEHHDLSAEIIALVEKRPGDLVRCTRIGGDTYRVNWWSARSTEGYDNPAIFGQTYGTHVVRQSRFMRVRSTPQGLKIFDAAAVQLARGRLR